LCWDTFPIPHVDFILMLQIVWKKFTIYQNRLSGRTSQQIRTQRMPELDFQVHQI
jgi:hypothetical protein